ncbi:hypothetical protein [Dietzia sp. B32]|uniref:hypothetical protein n=1 Tax=Dietzia sp. B32 TaxID=2915130 RepID=UPI0021AE1882|nr:hypothetical protein [Dietzia sp. B32]UVE93841.1 hypothetical protein L8M95_09660 [Dietzia sp. B32]
MTGLPQPVTSRTLVVVLAALVTVLVVAVGVTALVRPGGKGPDRVAGDATTSAPVTSPSSPRISRLVPPASAPEVTGVLEVSGPECDAGVINSDLLYPNSGAQIIDCGSGWAIMASAVSGDPYWVAYSGGRWRRVGDVSIYLGTCPADAIARGAPAWMAQKHLGDCGSRDRRGAPPSTPSGSSTVTTSPPVATSPNRTSSRTATQDEDSTTPATSTPNTTRSSVTTPSSTTATEVPTFTTAEADAAGE